MKNLYLIICILALCGCSGFLEEYSQDKSYIKGYDDLDEILLGNAYFERFYVSNGWQFSGIAGENYLPCLHVMSDELLGGRRGLRYNLRVSYLAIPGVREFGREDCMG